MTPELQLSVAPAQMLVLAAVGLGAGVLGSVVGLGGGIIVIPVLAMYMGVSMHQAIGASLLAVIATSTAASSVNVERGVTDIRLGMTLELATTIGATIAAVIAGFVNRTTLAVLFTCFLTYTALSMVRKAWAGRNEKAQAVVPAYAVQRYPVGLGASLVAGGMSGLLGIGGGAIKVPIMYLFMGVPLRVATATSNFMIGVTASASAFIYWGRGDVVLAIAAPVVVGVFAGSMVGARVAPRLRSSHVLFILITVTLYLAVQMAIKIARGTL